MNNNLEVDFDWEYIEARRLQAAIERFQGYEEEDNLMEIPGFIDIEAVKSLEEKRFDACIFRYGEMPEHRMLLDMDIWMNLKSEIIGHYYEKY